jgi:hypothetical protein
MKTDYAIQTLIIADKYNATQILDKIIEFIVINLQFICEMSEWKTFVAENSPIVLKIFKAIARKYNN